MSATASPPCRSMVAALLAMVGMDAVAAADLIFADEFEANCGTPLFVESFAVADGSAWPAPWVVAGNVDLADVQAGMGRLRPGPTGYSLARMKAPVSTRDVGVTFAFRFENDATQGIGFYVRQNGGYLTQTMPAGQGYAVFIEGAFRAKPGVGVWKETSGNEIEVAHSSGVPGPVAGMAYRARFETQQVSVGSTELRARFWLDGTQEPASWQITGSDGTASLQNVSGGIAIDSWSVLTSPTPIVDAVRVDDVVVTGLCVP